MKNYNVAALWRGSPAFRLSVVLFCMFVVSNIVLVVMLENVRDPQLAEVVLVGLVYGTVGAQLALHSVWTVFSSWNRSYRFLVSVSTALVLFVSPYVILLFVEGPIPAEAFTIPLLCLPLILIGVELPLWVIKASCGWAILPSQAGSGTVRKGTVTIQDLLLATAAIALAIAAIRFASTLDRWPLNNAFLIDMIITAGVLSAISLVTSVPALLATLRARRVIFFTLLAVTIQTTIFALWYTAMCILYESMPSVEESVALLGVYVVFMPAMYIPLLYLRKHGYRLRRAGDTSANKI